MDTTGVILAVGVVGIALWLASRRIRTIRQLMGLVTTIDQEGVEAAERRTEELQEDAKKGLTE